ncbi:hypothetical protein C9422_18650 [Pseudomonas sp. B1(2018)]|uniref:hypothetical protein n=1 Tax=Pseudomonas sp. B1(2018) TaxID=2233856 RepID=UPI000D5E7CE4|nr:hypothetical protein [Pseudomonas sp. B1(2018)]PVZ56544.1 hypothetical protein C9422_18650 [Pseudomonas sp. B1(2018)]
MNWKAISKHCMSSEEGYLLSKYALQDGHAYVARAPAGKILHSGKDLAKAKAACVDHLEKTQKVAA